MAYTDHWGPGGRTGPKLQVDFAGFRSDSYALTANGWRVHLSKDVTHYPDTWTVVFEHPGTRVALAGKVMDLRREVNRQGQAEVYIKRVVPDTHSTIIDWGCSASPMVEILPRFGFDAPDPEHRMSTLHGSGLFQLASAKQVQDIIVEPETVMDVLEKIRAMQQPELEAIHRRNKAREKSQQVLHGRIIALAA